MTLRRPWGNSSEMPSCDVYSSQDSASHTLSGGFWLQGHAPATCKVKVAPSLLKSAGVRSFAFGLLYTMMHRRQSMARARSMSTPSSKMSTTVRCLMIFCSSFSYKMPCLRSATWNGSDILLSCNAWALLSASPMISFTFFHIFGVLSGSVSKVRQKIAIAHHAKALPQAMHQTTISKSCHVMSGKMNFTKGRELPPLPPSKAVVWKNT
mmetsp:Transcript_99474/g.287131  ORF Transcript_99474/g.287131 Transcript_99474/m.287131 type:complete len:209 (-) Transcript_99474:2077-2703(-)